ncbi:MAG: hypothetical protein KJ621_03595 [Proteobacteria bacterium]|nr:hypothetical protein [Pseudomonadota bacterium]MBU1742187.1 hypothetical protein [Pseudomonadota bacterium]
MRCQYCDEKITGRQCKECGGETLYEAVHCHRCGAKMPDLPPAEAGGGDVATRRLCSDGMCIGIIGADGRCKECGKPYAGDS